VSSGRVPEKGARRRVVTRPMGVGARPTRGEQLRDAAARIVDEVIATKGDDARDRRIDLVTAYLAAMIAAARDGAIARITSKMTAEERAAIHARMLGEVTP